MASNQKAGMKDSFVDIPAQNEEKNVFLQKSNGTLAKSNISNGDPPPKVNQNKDDVIEHKEIKESQEINQWEEDGDEGEEKGQAQDAMHAEQGNEREHADENQPLDNEGGQLNEGYEITLPGLNNEKQKSHTSKKPDQDSNQLKSLLAKFQQQLDSLLKSANKSEFSTPEHQRKVSELQTNIEILQIKLSLKEKLKNRKQLISFERINHLELIFKHYCTHIFKTGKHMTFDRLQYEKVHLTIDRLSVFLKDFNLTSVKMKDNRVREIIQKQQIIKLFKKISPNCRDLDFQQFILILEKLGQLYFDSKITYEQRKLNERKERLKIKEILEKKQKYKQEMLKKHQQKIQRLQKGINDSNDQIKQKVHTQGGENDELIEKMIIQGTDDIEEDKKSRISKQTKSKNISKSKKSASLYSKTFKRQMDAQLDKQSNSPLALTKQEKIEYFYEIINVDDIQSFSNKMRELNLPLFKIYAGKQNAKKQIQKQQRQEEYLSAVQGSKVQTDDEKRLKELREKLNERNQKIKQSSVPSLNKEEYELRKLKRSRLHEETEGSVKIQRKAKKVDLTDGEINLSSLSKLAYENVNFSKFNPRAFYKKQDDDEIFLQEYGDSPVRTRKPQAKTQLMKSSPNSNRLMDQKEKNSENFLQKLKQRQSEIEINQKKEEVSQMYRFNDRTQRQKRLIDKFLDKNK